jgi:hypothetical protein
MESPTGLQSMRQASMTQAVDSQPVQPLISPTPSELDSAEHGFGSSVHLDVIDLAAPDEDY